MSRKSPRRAAAAGVVVVVASLTACAPGVPDTVVPDTTVTVGWTGEITSFNAAASPTRGNIDIAEATRSSFGDIVDGEFVPDESFGTVTIVSDIPFTARYDLAEPAWSDGIPLDAADLLLGWAAGSGLLAPEGETEDEDEADLDDDAEVQEAPIVPELDEFARAIEVTSPEPTIGWQSAIEASVPAHVVGGRAFGLDDAMEAKQAVIRAIQDEDDAALEAVGEAWTDTFDVTEVTDVPAYVRLSSGAYQVDGFTRDDDGQSVTLVPNPLYAGAATPQVARIDLVPMGDDGVSAIGGRIDVVQVAPTLQNRAIVDDFERRDNPVLTSHDGTVWTVLLRPTGVFAKPAARTAFLRTVPARDIVDRGAGGWASAYTATTSMLSAPGSPAYDIVNEDSGFASVLGTPSREPALERAAAGVAAGTSLCVLYDRGSEFAVGAFEALRDAVGAEGWNIVDCGTDDIVAEMDEPGWDAAITRVSLPQTPAQIAAQWGSGSETSLIGDADADRDELITQLDQTVDVYEARELLARIESSIVRAAVARPFAVNPTVTVTDRAVTGVSVRSGPVAPLIHDLEQWAVVE
ncbi:hypothetical protein [Marisediminicola sp. LYQ85]|uniref:hypothetical protein n=1 Tax=Marisediminicola sp. LYQ85 TaxID=3391062 RepID=UPI003983B0DB